MAMKIKSVLWWYNKSGWRVWSAPHGIVVQGVLEVYSSLCEFVLVVVELRKFNEAVDSEEEI